MDLLGHVNNVTYVDYLQEARVDLFDATAPFAGGEELAEGVVVVRHEIDFVAPLVFRREPVAIDMWITEVRAASFTIGYEIYDDVADGRRVYVRASTTLAPFVFGSERPRRVTEAERDVLLRLHHPEEARPRLPRDGVSRHVLPMRVRWSDVDAYRHVNNVCYVTYVQEARIDYLTELGVREGGDRGFVAARTDLDYRRPLFFRPEPYDVHSWVSRVGTSSFTVATEIRDGDEVLASAQTVMVAFDTARQRAVPLTEHQRAVLLAELPG